MLQIYKRFQYIVTMWAKKYTFYLFVILCFRSELRWPSDLNREATIFCYICKNVIE